MTIFHSLIAARSLEQIEEIIKHAFEKSPPSQQVLENTEIESMSKEHLQGRLNAINGQFLFLSGAKQEVEAALSTLDSDAKKLVSKVEGEFEPAPVAPVAAPQADDEAVAAVEPLPAGETPAPAAE